jgi:hypothetical protein
MQHKFCKLIFLPVIIGLLFSGPALAERSPYDWALIQLDHVREEKVEQLGRFCKRIHGLARNAAEDERIAAFFNMNQQYELATRQGAVPDTLTEDIAQLRKDFDGYYIRKYFAFYDILFIGLDGKVFYTIRKEADINTRLLEEDTKTSPLAESIASIPAREVFVDFHNYGPSGEPAAFFVEAIHHEGRHTGWIALQIAINKVNSLFSATEDLGQTGETFLVNEEGFMLTKSHLVAHPAILRKHLADENIRAKFQAGQGHRTVTDYRGVTALTSFEVFPFMNTRWLVVAKVDKNEITTNHYKRHRRFYAERLDEHLHHAILPPMHKPATGDRQPVLRVDMDEFLRAGEDQPIQTWGVSTCTALLIAYPGRFAYLAHVSPKDRLYGGRETNLLGQMARHLLKFDIYPYQNTKVKFFLAAPNLDILIPAVNAIIDHGFLLSQIQVLYNASAKSGAVVYDPSADDLEVTWTMPDGANGAHDAGDAVNVGKIVEQMVEPGE